MAWTCPTRARSTPSTSARNVKSWATTAVVCNSCLDGHQRAACLSRPRVDPKWHPFLTASSLLSPPDALNISKTVAPFPFFVAFIFVHCTEVTSAGIYME